MGPVATDRAPARERLVAGGPAASGPGVRPVRPPTRSAGCSPCRRCAGCRGPTRCWSCAHGARGLSRRDRQRVPVAAPPRRRPRPTLGLLARRRGLRARAALAGVRKCSRQRTSSRVSAGVAGGARPARVRLGPAWLCRGAGRRAGRHRATEGVAKLDGIMRGTRPATACRPASSRCCCWRSSWSRSSPDLVAAASSRSGAADPVVPGLVGSYARRRRPPVAGRSARSGALLDVVAACRRSVASAAAVQAPRMAAGSARATGGDDEGAAAVFLSCFVLELSRRCRWRAGRRPSSACGCSTAAWTFARRLWFCCSRPSCSSAPRLGADPVPRAAEGRRGRGGLFASSTRPHQARRCRAGSRRECRRAPAVAGGSYAVLPGGFGGGVLAGVVLGRPRAPVPRWSGRVRRPASRRCLAPARLHPPRRRSACWPAGSRSPTLDARRLAERGSPGPRNGRACCPAPSPTTYGSGRPGASDAEVDAGAPVRAGLDLVRLGRGSATPARRRRRRLSGGQRRRLALARVFSSRTGAGAARRADVAARRGRRGRGTRRAGGARAGADVLVVAHRSAPPHGRPRGRPRAGRVAS